MQVNEDILLDDLSDDEYFKSMETFIKESMYKEHDYHFEAPDSISSATDVWSHQATTEIEVKENFATREMSKSLQLKKKL